MEPNNKCMALDRKVMRNSDDMIKMNRLAEWKTYMLALSTG